MNIRAIFPTGVTELTVNGLHQWDYGQKLVIQADNLPTIFEVHFYCPGMQDAVVRSCVNIFGSASASIPDRCLEQTAPIVAWVYAVGETEGSTILTITMPVIARAQPQPAATVPEDISDKYTEAVAAMNELVGQVGDAINNAKGEVYDAVAEDIRNGTLAVANANHAVSADSATEAGHADSADTATKALYDQHGAPLEECLRSSVGEHLYYDPGEDGVGETSIQGGIVAFRITRLDYTSEGTPLAADIRIITEVGDKTYKKHFSAVFYDEVVGGKNTGFFPMRLVFEHYEDATYNVRIQAFINSAWVVLSQGEYPGMLYYKHLTAYPIG